MIPDIDRRSTRVESALPKKRARQITDATPS
jgi:hypothetical protein